MQAVIRRTAEEVREWAFGDEDATQICDICSVQLAACLRRAGLSVDVVLGQFKIDIPTGGPPFGPVNPGHYWVLVEGRHVVDVTGDQFNQELHKPHPRVYVGLAEDAIRYLNGKAVALEEEDQIREHSPFAEFY